MGDVVPFRRPKPSSRAEGLMLCRRGHHRWVIDQTQRFDSKLGRLVTVLRCSRCNATRNEGR